MPRSLRPQFNVTPKEQQDLNKLLKKFEAKEVKELGNNPKDLMYAIKLIEHYKNIEETGGHLYKRFVEGPLSIEQYTHHKAFFDATKKYKQVLFRAANRCGKSDAGAYAASCWTTGVYPNWWEGREFYKPTFGLVCGDTNDTVREILQAKLLGSPRGTGFIPADCLEDVIIRPNTGGTADSILIRHKPSGKLSRIKFKTYEQGAEAFYGLAPDWVWFDEEPTGRDAALIWNQGYTRLLTTQGTMIVTFTPLMGWTPILREFCDTATDLTPPDDEYSVG